MPCRYATAETGEDEEGSEFAGLNVREEVIQALKDIPIYNELQTARQVRLLL